MNGLPLKIGKHSPKTQVEGNYQHQVNRTKPSNKNAIDKTNIEK